MDFLSDDVLERSSVVANCCMNGHRSLVGSNSYSRDLGFNPLAMLQGKAASGDVVHWLDLCCGSGKALIEAAQLVQDAGSDGKISIFGVDLVGMFFRPDSQLKSLRLAKASLSTWQPECPFDLITCVHGLHYIGDKLGLIARVASWLTKDGLFAGNLDLNSIKLQDGSSAARMVSAELRNSGLHYESRQKRIVCIGHRNVKLSFRYLGADDQAGPNYTGQPAVDSYYEVG